MTRQIALDTETTGLSPAEGHKIIEIGCIELIDRRLTGRHFHYYLQPDRPIDKEAEKVHGISQSFLQDKPRFADIVESFLSFIEGAELVIHNAAFDLGFLNHELALLGGQYAKIKLENKCSVIDSLVLARQKHPGQKNSLDAICKRYFIDLSVRGLHGALLDSTLLAKAYLAMTRSQEKFMLEGLSSNAKNDQEVRSEKACREGLIFVEADEAALLRHQAFCQKKLKTEAF